MPTVYDNIKKFEENDELTYYLMKHFIKILKRNHNIRDEEKVLCKKQS